MDFLISCTVFKNQLKSLFDLSEVVGYKSYCNIGFWFRFKVPKTVKICENGWSQLSGLIRIYHHQSVHEDYTSG